MEQNERRDIEIWRGWAQIMALEVAVTALLRSHPEPAALAAAWKDAEDMGFNWTSDPQDVGAARTALIQGEYVETMARLRAARASP